MTYYRGEKMEIPPEIRHELSYFLWVFLQINRFYLLHTLLSLAGFSALGLALGKPSVPLTGSIGLQLFYLSLAWHEAAHFGMARVLGIRCTAFSLLATHFEMRTVFAREHPIDARDLMIIVLAGPLLPLLPLAVILVFSLGLKAPLWIYFALLLLSAIQWISLLPLGRTDGKRVCEYIKKNPAQKKLLFSLMVYYYYCLFQNKTVKEFKMEALWSKTPSANRSCGTIRMTGRRAW